jgi:MYXO-CTERM domain-containing protein
VTPVGPGDPDAAPGPGPGDEPGGCCQTGAPGAPGGSTTALALVLALVVRRRQRP